jgi:hypothetical protein
VWKREKLEGHGVRSPAFSRARYKGEDEVFKKKEKKKTKKTKKKDTS